MKICIRRGGIIGYMYYIAAEEYGMKTHKESIEYIFRLYEERQPIYERVSHIKIENISNVADVVQAVVAALPNASL